MVALARSRRWVIVDLWHAFDRNGSASASIGRNTAKMDFLGIGPTELVFTVVVALIVLGPAKMLDVTRSLGRIMGEIRRITSDLPNLLSLDEGHSEPPSATEARNRTQQTRKDAQGEEETEERSDDG
jgi:sec-independent protein translocase protein TatB